MNAELPLRNGTQTRSVRTLSVIEAVRRRPLLAFGTPIAVVALTVAFVLWVPPLFESGTLVRVDEERSDVAMLQALQTLSSEGSEIQTEMAVLRSRTLAESVTERVALQLRVQEPSRTRRAALLADIRADTAALETTYTLERIGDGRFRVTSTVVLPRDVARPFARKRSETREAGAIEVGTPAALEGVRFTLTPEADRHERIVLHLATFADAVEELQRTLGVGRPDREANVIYVAYRNTDPELTQRVLDALTARYIESRQGFQSSDAHATVRFLDERLGTLGAQLAAAEERLRDFSEANQIVAPDEQAAEQVLKLLELKAEHDVLETERAALDQLMGEVRSEFAARPQVGPGATPPASPYRRLLAFPSLLANSVPAELLRLLAESESQLAEKLMLHTPEDRDVVLLVERIQALDAQLQGIAETYLSSLERQVAGYEGVLAGSQAALAGIPDAQMTYYRLRRESELLSDIYVLLQTKRSEAELQAAVVDQSVRVVDPAIYPRVPVRPRPALSLVAAALVGTLLGLGGAVAAEHRDRSVRDRKDVGRVTGGAVLGLIPELRLAGAGARLPVPWVGNGLRHRPHLVSQIAAGDPAVEAYRTLRTNLLFSRIEKPPRVVVFTSPMPGDGKSTTAVNLALVLAQQGHKILLVDADMRRGVLHEVVQAPREPGLSEVLFGKVPFSEAVSAVQPREGVLIDFLPSGIWPPNPAELIASPRMHELLTRAREGYEMVILDAPPLNLVTDAAVLGTHCDGVVLVARAGVTEESPLEYAVEQLASVRAPLLGTVLNGVESSAQDYYGTRQGRAYAYLRSSESKKRI